MSRKKLTLTVEESAIQQARKYSRRHGTSISEMVSRYFRSLEEESGSVSPAVSRLRGILHEEDSVADYREYQRKKYGA